MSSRRNKLMRRELAAAVMLAAVWAVLGFVLSAVFAKPASGGEAAAGTAALCPGACRVTNQLPGGTTNVGSGTLVDVAAGGERGLVLTCAHLWSEGAGQAMVTFADGRTHGARLAAIDREADLAAVEIANPRVAAAIVSPLASSPVLSACGFGPTGAFRCVRGRVLGLVENAGQTSAKIEGAVRSGDSGGGVFDDSGRLVGVVWGECDGVTYASTGAPLRKFLSRVLGRTLDEAPAAPVDSPLAICPDGQCPLTAPPVSREATPRRGAADACGDDCDCEERYRELARTVDGLVSRPSRASGSNDDAVAERSPAGSRLNPGAALSPGDAWLAKAAAALGISGSAGWGVLAGASVVSGLAGRWLRGRAARRAAAARAEATAAAVGPFRGAEQVAIDECQPIERDDREARELLRLSQLEGRDPLQDALAGRLALDRLDATAESDADPQQASWADALRRELRERFNDVAPTKFQVNAEG
jgi:hypothetical protein